MNAPPRAGTAGPVVVTGANGFIGRQVCGELVAHGFSVRGLVRSGRSPAGATYPLSDVTDRDALVDALRGASAVVHLAGRAHLTRDRGLDRRGEYRRVNVQGTRVLLDAMRETHVHRLILASSVKAVGETTDGGGPWRDDVDPHPSSDYARSKLEAEQLVQSRAHDGLRATILRLPLVYGAGVRANMLTLFRLVDRRIPLPFAAVRNARSLAYVGNVASAIRSLLATDRLTGPHFISDGRDLSTADLVRAIAGALNVPPVLFPVPVRVLHAAGSLAHAVSAVLPAASIAAAVERLVGSLTIDSSPLWRSLGYPPPFTLEQGLAATARWYRTARSEPADT